MTRLDKFVIFCVLVGVIGSLFIQLVYNPVLGRRPIPAQPLTAEPAHPSAEAVPQRVRRPLPSPSPFDPLFSAAVEDVPAGSMMVGTSFPVGAGAWLTARHVANAGCRAILLGIDDSYTGARINYLAQDADLALVQTAFVPTPPLPVSSADVVADESGYAFGYPSGVLGGAEGSLMGRSRMKLEGRLSGTGPVLTWAEVRRFPENLDELAGISGGPMFDAEGAVIGIAVATSIRRGRIHTVAPEVLRAVETASALFGPRSRQVPAVEIALRAVVSLSDVAAALAANQRITKTYCIPIRN
jgi:hypothetical protein